jgi:uncharacterized integral membrane protein
MSATQTPEQQQEAPPQQRRSRREQSRTIALITIAVVITAFALTNLDEVKVHWIFGSSRAPLIVVIVISLVVGIVLTRVAARRSNKRR